MTQVMNATDSAIGQGVYTLSEVARLTGTHCQRIRSWFLKRPYRPEPILKRGPRQSQKRRAQKHGDFTVSFHSLIDALVVARLRDYGVSMQYLRRVHGTLIQEFGNPHPFSRRDLYTDGRKVFLGYADEFGEESLKELLTKQHSFPQILRDYLTQIEYEEDTLLAVRWRVGEGVVIDPKRRYGKPIVESCGVPTAILAAAYKANREDSQLVAEWYGVSPPDVEHAVVFEKRLLSRVA